MEENKLVEVRCPFQKKARHSFYRDGKMIKAGEVYSCNMLCVKVYPGSAGEAFCSSCKLGFDFEHKHQQTVHTSIRVKSIK